MIESLNANQDVDMSTLPPKPPQSSGSSAPAAASASSSAPAAGPSSTSASAQQPEAFDVPEITQDDASKLFNAPKSANTVLEALQQRLDKFKSTLKEATDEQNASKARRLGRVVKQVEGAIKDYKAGKPVDFDSIPCPPGLYLTVRTVCSSSILMYIFATIRFSRYSTAISAIGEQTCSSCACTTSAKT